MIDNVSFFTEQQLTTYFLYDPTVHKNENPSAMIH